MEVYLELCEIKLYHIEYICDIFLFFLFEQRQRRRLIYYKMFNSECWAAKNTRHLLVVNVLVVFVPMCEREKKLPKRINMGAMEAPLSTI